MLNQLPTKEIEEFLGNGTVLVLEPTANYRNSIKRFLTNLKITRVKTVSDVAEARREMLTTRVSLFISEWNLEGSNGIQFCRDIRKELSFKTTPFLLLSVENLKKDIILASEVQIDGYLLKPFSFEDFRDQILTIIHNHARPNRLNTLIHIAEEKMERGDHASAEKILNEALKLNADSARALCGLATIFEHRGQKDTACNYLKQATVANPNYIGAFKRLLEHAEKDKDYESILETAMYLHSLSPDNPKYVLTIAKAHLHLQSLELAEQFFKKTVSLSPKIAAAYKGLGNIYMIQNEYDKAMKNFSKALDLDQDDISTLNSYGMALVRLSKFEAGIEKYQIALKIDPHNYHILFNLGQAFEKQSNFERATHYYMKSLDSNPNFEKAKRAIERSKANLAGKKIA